MTRYVVTTLKPRHRIEGELRRQKARARFARVWKARLRTHWVTITGYSAIVGFFGALIITGY